MLQKSNLRNDASCMHVQGPPLAAAPYMQTKGDPESKQDNKTSAPVAQIHGRFRKLRPETHDVEHHQIPDLKNWLHRQPNLCHAQHPCTRPRTLPRQACLQCMALTLHCTWSGTV